MSFQSSSSINNDKVTAAVTYEVNAPFDIVWEVICDIDAIPKYNPTYISIDYIPASSSTANTNTNKATKSVSTTTVSSSSNNNNNNNNSIKLQVNDRIHAVRKDGQVQKKVISNISNLEENVNNKCCDNVRSLSFVESCTSTYTLTVKGNKVKCDDDNDNNDDEEDLSSSTCYLIGSFAATPNKIIPRILFCLFGSCCLYKIAIKIFTTREVVPIVNEAEARWRGRCQQQQQRTS